MSIAVRYGFGNLRCSYVDIYRFVPALLLNCVAV